MGTDVSFKRPDRAYVEYLVSSELLLNIIPKHKDFPDLNGGRGDWQQIYKSLRKVSAAPFAYALIHKRNGLEETQTESGAKC